MPSLYIPPSFWPGTQGPRRRTAAASSKLRLWLPSRLRLLPTHTQLPAGCFKDYLVHTSLGPFFGCFSGFAFPACIDGDGRMLHSTCSGQQLLHPVSLLLQATFIPQVFRAHHQLHTSLPTIALTTPEGCSKGQRVEAGCNAAAACWL